VEDKLGDKGLNTMEKKAEGERIHNMVIN